VKITTLCLLQIISDLTENRESISGKETKHLPLKRSVSDSRRLPTGIREGADTATLQWFLYFFYAF